MSPWVVFFLGIFAFPLVFAVWMSFYDYFFSAPGAVVDRPFVGLDNYANALTDPQVHESFGNVIVFLVINVPLTVVLAIVLAIALNAAIPFRSFFRTAYFMPYVTASVATIAVWLWLFSGDGLVNQVLGPRPQTPRGSSTTPWRCRPSRSTSPGSSSVSMCCSTWPPSRTSRRSSTRRPRSTGPAGGASSAM